jgi:surface antigen
MSGRTIIRNFAVLGLVGTMAAGCVQGTSSQTLGTLGGAVAGGAIGSAFGSGSGQIAAIAAGTLLGGFLGNQIGANMDAQDEAYYGQAHGQALAYGGSHNWNNPQSGHYGTVQTGPVQVINNSQCRSYNSTIYVNGRPEVATGTACQQPDGSWRLIS